MGVIVSEADGKTLTSLPEVHAVPVNREVSTVVVSGGPHSEIIGKPGS